MQPGVNMEVHVDIMPVSREDEFASTLLRVPPVFMLEVLHRIDLLQKLETFGFSAPNAFFLGVFIQYFGCLSVVIIQILPIEYVMHFYGYLVTVTLMITAHLLSSNYISGEEETGYDGWVIADTNCLLKWVMYTAAQLAIMYVCARVAMNKPMYGFSAYLLPLLVRLIPDFPLTELKTANTFAATFTILQAMTIICSCTPLSSLYHIIVDGYRVIADHIEIFGVLNVTIAIYNQFFKPAVYLVFWLVLFGMHVANYLLNSSHPIWNENWAIILLALVADCCVSPWSLIGLCYTVSYLAYVILTLSKVYLQGSEGFVNDNILHRGWTEGITLLLLALQTGVLEMKKVHRVFLLSIVLFVVFASTLQSMHEITEPVLMALTAANNRNFLHHIKVLIMCIFLFVFPLYMTYIVCMFFEAEFWLLVIVSSSVLTSVQMLASTLTYALFMIDNYRREPWENLDDLVYCIKALSHILEFFVAISVLVYGALETAYSDHSIISATIIIVHCYFNVWKRAQMGWESFLQRRDAMRKVDSLPAASQEQLDEMNDICAICYQELKNARITPCNHIFHALCLRKWLYVQDKCPLCHRSVVTKEDTTQQ
ncbi:RING finger protein 145-like [Glandiceps talaboti]